MLNDIKTSLWGGLKDLKRNLSLLSWTQIFLVIFFQTAEHILMLWSDYGSLSFWPGSVHREAGGAVFLHPVCSNLSRAAKTDKQRRMEGADDSLLLAWNITNNKSHRKPHIKLQPLAYIWRDKALSRSSGFITTKVSVFVCDELAEQHLIVGFWLWANIFIANGANFLVALGPDVT